MGQTAHRIPAELFTAAQIMVGGTAADALYIGNTQVFGGGVVTDVDVWEPPEHSIVINTP